MWGWVDQFGVIALDTALSAAALLAVASVAMVRCRQPARRLRVARAAMIGLLALFPLDGMGLIPRVSLRTAAEGLRAFEPGGSQVSAGAATAAAPGTVVVNRRGQVRNGVRRQSRSEAVAPRVAVARQSPTRNWPEWENTRPSADPGRHSWPAWVARSFTILYLAGVTTGLLRLALGWLGLIVVGRQAAEPSDASRRLYDSLPYRRPGARPEFRVSSRLRRPALAGVVRPAVLIPAALDLQQPDPESTSRLRLALLHELAHAEGRDLGYNLVTQAARALWFFLPQSWWIADRMRLDQEFLADRRAADSFGGPGDYASSLVALAEATAGRRDTGDEARTASVAADRREASPLVQRVLMLLRSPFPLEIDPPAWWTNALPYTAVVVTVAASSLSLRPTAADPVERPSAPDRIFLIDQVDVPPRTPDRNGRASPVEWEVALPERFDLTVEVWGDLATLARMRIAGLRLESTATTSDASAPTPVWHRVRIRRNFERVILTIDGHATPLPNTADSLTPQLSLEPAPDHLAHVRNVLLIGL